jgi:hypothetical protein
MPAPIMPAPRTPSLRTVSFSAWPGRWASLSAFCLLTKSVRTMFRATGSRTSLVKYRASIRRPASIGTAVPSYTADRIEIGAG